MTKTILLFASLAALTTGCVTNVGDNEEDATGTQSEAVHSVAQKDAQYPAVAYIKTKVPGFSRGCTGTLIGPRTVLTAAHCVSSIAKGCPKEALIPGIHVTFTKSGDRNSTDTVTYEVDDVIANHAAYPGLDPNVPGNCSDLFGNVSSVAAEDNIGLQSSNDIALLRLKIDTSKVAPFRYATPMPVITSVDGGTSTAPGAIRVSIDTARRFGALHNNLGAVPAVVGFGAADTTDPWRRAGWAWFAYNDNWDANGVMKIYRQGYFDTTTSAWVYNGASIAPGDSGGPLVVYGGTQLAGVPELAPGQYELGVTSRGDQTPGGSTLASTNQTRSTYSPTFNTGNGFLIELALAAWNIKNSDWPLPIIHIFPGPLPF